MSGAILILYLITQNLRFVSVGLILVLGGYALQAWSILKTDFPKSSF